MTVPPAASEAEVVARLRRRDRSAWEDVYRLYGDRLYRFAYHLAGNPHDAADLVQETFVRALPRLDELDAGELNLGAYLFATERNLFLKSVARAQRELPVEEAPEQRAPTPRVDEPEPEALVAQQQADVRRANAALAPRQRLVLALRELDGRGYAEIGELVGLNENAVAQLISRARQRLREELRLVQVDRSKLPEECRALLPKLSAYLDGQLRGSAAETTLAHLDGCELCQAALSDMREASRLYRALVPIPVVELFERTTDALAAVGYWRPGPARPAPRGRRRRLAAGATAGAAVLAAVAGGLVAGRSGEPSAAEAGPDTDPPRLVLPRRIDSEATSPAGARVAYAVSAEDEVDGRVDVRCAPARGEVVPLGKTTARCTAVDEAGNAARGSFPIEVADTTPPVLVLPDAVTTEARGPSGSRVSYASRATDRADRRVAARCTPGPGVRFPLGPTAVACTARDAAGNVRRGAFTVTVRDTSAPRLTLPTALTLRPGDPLTYEVSAHDTVDGARAHTCTPEPGTALAAGVTRVICTSRDRRGNVARGSFAVTVSGGGQGAAPRPPSPAATPVLRLPRRVRVEADGPGGRRVRYAASASGTGGALAVRCAPQSGSLFALGNSRVDCAAKGRAGGATKGSFRVVVVDTTPPVLAVPRSLTLEATGPTGAPARFDAAARDRVDGPRDVSCTPQSGTTVPLGTTSVRCTARDRRGNTARANFRVTVVDTTPPELSVPDARTVRATSPAGATVTFTATAVDLVDGPLTPRCTPASGSTFPVGATVVACSARDSRGNERRRSFGVTVTPPERPDLVVRAVSGRSFTVANVGGAGAGAFVVTVQGAGTFTFRGLAAGASVTRTLTCASVQRLVTVDPANQVTESNERNNTARIPAC